MAFENADATMHTTPIARWSLSRWVSIGALLGMALIFPIFTRKDFLSFGPVPYFLAVFVVLALVLVWRGIKWVQALGALVMAVMFAGNASFIFPNLTRPDHYPDYILATVGSLLILAAIGAAIASFTAAARRPARVRSGGMLVVVLVLGAAVGVASAGIAMHEAPLAGAGAIALTPDATAAVNVRADQFAPASVSIPAGKIVRLDVTNGDSGLHLFNLDAPLLKADLQGGKLTNVWVKFDTSGTYTYYCELHSSVGADGKRTGMVGTLVVQ